MAIERFISIREVVSKIYRDLNLQEEDRWVDIIEWCAEALLKIGAHPQYIEKADTIDVTDYRASLPCDLHKIIQIGKSNIPLIKSTGSFSNSTTEDTQHLKSKQGLEYSVNDAFINTNFKEGTIQIAYLAVPTDEDGFPLVPDDEGYKEAMEKYVIMKLKYPEFINGTYNPNLYQKIERDWHLYCAQARGNANMPTIDDMESIKNQWVRLLPQLQEHKHFFNKLNDRERIAGNKLPYTNRY
jgi:hypothetical protein